MIIIIIVLLIVIVAGIFAAAMFLDKENKETAASGIPVQTPYGEIYFSDEWTAYYDDEIVEENGSYTITFFAKYEDYKGELFSLIFAKNSDATLIGTIEDDNVYIDMKELDIPKDVPDEKVNAFYGMQEEVNRIMEQLDSIGGYDPAE